MLKFCKMGFRRTYRTRSKHWRNVLQKKLPQWSGLTRKPEQAIKGFEGCRLAQAANYIKIKRNSQKCNKEQHLHQRSRLPTMGGQGKKNKENKTRHIPNGRWSFELWPKVKMKCTEKERERETEGKTLHKYRTVVASHSLAKEWGGIASRVFR